MMNFQPTEYHHWRLELQPPLATLSMDVSAQDTAFPGYELKMNSYDIGVDIELNDIVQRLRFEHPEIKTVILGSARSGSWCAGANIRMLAQSSHAHKVNFCKFTNETRNAIEDASRCSGQTYMAAIDGTAAGGGYELALATDYLLLIDDGTAAVALPEVPLLAVLPGTGGLTRLVDKRKVRRDLADVFATREEGVRGERAVSWRLVDETVPRSRFQARLTELAMAAAQRSDRPDDGGITLQPLQRTFSVQGFAYEYVKISLDAKLRSATFLVTLPTRKPPQDLNAMLLEGADFWPLAVMRQLDDAVLHLRFNEPEIGTWIFTTQGSPGDVAVYDALLQRESQHWLVREILLFIKRTFKRVDVSARSIFTLVEPGSCFVGFLAELVFAADHSYMLEGSRTVTGAESGNAEQNSVATLTLTESNFGTFPMPNDLSRLHCRFYGEPEHLGMARALIGQPQCARKARETGLVTFTPDAIDWQDEIRLLLEERAAFSPDALTGMEANLRFPGPETMESKIFARLTAWQNWIFQRPNAVGEEGALQCYGSGKRPNFSHQRV